MRWFALAVVVAGCTKSPPSPPEPAPAPAPTVAPPAPAPAPPAPVPLPVSLTARCPLGDGTNVALYGFLETAIADARTQDRGRRATRELLAREVADEASGIQVKPPRASIVESETSNILTTLCTGTPGCVAVGLYNASGLAMALSSRKAVAPLGFGEDARWNQLLGEARADGAIAELTCPEAKTAGLPCGGGHRYVLVRVPDGGLALCIVDR